MADDLQRLVELWGAKLPERFAALYDGAIRPVLPVCAFPTLAELAGGAGRAYGQFPPFLPFSEAMDGDGWFGFYRRSGAASESWPVWFADADEGFLRPVASDFGAFLRGAVLTGRYRDDLLHTGENDGANETEEDAEDTGPTQADAQAAAAIAANAPPLSPERLAALGVPESVLTGVLPRNDTELHRRLAALDAGDAVSRCHLGCAALIARDDAQAQIWFQAARAAAPYFGDPHYLLADIFRDRDGWEQAVPLWWQTAQTPVVLCTRSWEWNLGDDYPDADIYELAADCLAQYAKYASPSFRADPLWRVVAESDPYDPEIRFALARTLQKQGDLSGSEREFVNALTLGAGERGRLPERAYDALRDLFTAQGRDAECRLLAFDRALPRSA